MNKEGYKDPTAEQAIGKADREIRNKNKDLNHVLYLIKIILSLVGFELVGKMHLRDKETRKEYWR